MRRGAAASEACDNDLLRGYGMVIATNELRLTGLEGYATEGVYELRASYWRGRSGHTQRAAGGTVVKIGRSDGKVEDNSRETLYVGARSARVGATGSRASCAADPPTKRCREVSGRPTTGVSSFR